MALVVLLLVWGALAVTWFRSRANDGGFGDPVGTFNRHLRILEKTSPSRYTAANQRRPARPGTIAPYRPGSTPGRRTAPAARGARPAPQASLRRAQSQKRRRDVFFALLAGVLGSLVLAIIPGLGAMMYIQVLFDLLMVGYIALLVRMRNLAAERELKLAYMPASRRVQPARAPLRQSRTRAAGGYAMAAGYDGYEDDYSYADLTVRRAAN